MAGATLVEIFGSENFDGPPKVVNIFPVKNLCRTVLHVAMEGFYRWWQKGDSPTYVVRASLHFQQWLIYVLTLYFECLSLSLPNLHILILNTLQCTYVSFKFADSQLYVHT